MSWRAVRWGSAGALFLVLLVAVGLVNWLIRTESGTRWILAQVEERAGGVLAVQSIEGTLTRGLTAFGIRIESNGSTVEIARLEVNLRLRPLWDRRLEIPELIVGSVTYTQIADSEAAVGNTVSTSGFNSPFDIEVEAASIEALSVIVNETTIDFGATSLAARLVGDSLVLQGLTTSTSGVSVETDLELSLQNELTAAASFVWSGEFDEMAWSGSGRAEGSLARLEFRHQLLEPAEILAEGNAAFADEPSADIVVSWEDLDWPGLDQYQSAGGRVALSGWLDAFDAEGQGRVTIDGIDAELVTTASLAGNTLQIENLQFGSALGSGTVSGTVGLDPVSWDLEVDGTDLDPSVFLENWTATLAARGRLQGTLEPALQWSFSEMEVRGDLLDLPLVVTGGVASDGANRWRLDELDIDLAGNVAFVDGTIDQTIDLRVRANAPEIGALSSIVSGSFAVNGNVSGSLEAPSFVGSAVGDSLMLGSLSIRNIQLAGSVSAEQGNRNDIAFLIEDLSAGPQIARWISGSVTGVTGAHEFTMVVDSPIGPVEAHAVGGWLDNRWTGEFDRFAVQQPQLGRWELREPAAVAFGQGTAIIDTSCLYQNSTRLCLGGEIGTPTERLLVELESFQLAALQFLVDPRLTIAGSYDASISLTGPFDNPTGTLSMIGNSTLISIRETEEPLDIPIERVEVEASLNEQRLAFSGGMQAADQARIDFAGNVSDFNANDPGIDMQINGRWSDLAFLSLLSPDIGQVSGVATIALGVSGTFDAPEISADARWIDGQIIVPRWGLVMDEIDLVVDSPDSRLLRYELNAVSGEGQVALAGSTELSPEAQWATTLTLRGDRLTAVQLPEAEVLVSPNLEVVTAWPRIEVTGDVSVPFARMSQSALPAGVVTTSPDVVVHGRDGAAEQRPLDIVADLRLLIGDDVRFSGSGLDAALTGELGLSYRSGESASANGIVMVAGTYSTLGQTLELDRGQLLFSGPLTDPILDVRAVRRFETTGEIVLVGVLVGGTVNQPTTRLFSEPSMSDGDIVSYLVVGRPLSDSSRENSQALQAAAVSLGLTQALPQIQHFGEAIGLDELGVRASNANTGELMAGKQISPRMYVRYSYGLMNRMGGLLLRFELSDVLSLETRTGEFKAMDLLFMVERE